MMVVEPGENPTCKITCLVFLSHIKCRTNDDRFTLPVNMGDLIQFRFLRPVCLTNLKVPVGLILTQTSVMRVSIPLHLSSRPCIELPRFIHSHHPPSSHSFPRTSVSVTLLLFIRGKRFENVMGERAI